MRKISRRPNEPGKDRVYFGSRRIIKRRMTNNKRHGVKFNRRRRLIIFAAVSKGLPLSAASRLAGITPDRAYLWMKMGKDPVANPSHYLFKKKIRKLQAEVEKQSLDVILGAQKGGSNVVQTKVVFGRRGTEITKTKKTLAPSWAAAAWFLERRHRDKYGKDAPSLEKEKSAEDFAHEVRNIAKDLFESVPIAPKEEEE